MDYFDTFVGEWRTVGFIVGDLGDLAIDDFTVFVQGELALGGHRMVEFDVDVVDVAWHGGLTCAFGVCWAVVPFPCDACKVGSVKFFGDFIVLLESLSKMIQVGVSDVLDCKNVNNKGKHDGVPLVLPKAWGGGCFVVVKFGKAFTEEVVC